MSETKRKKKKKVSKKEQAKIFKRRQIAAIVGIVVLVALVVGIIYMNTSKEDEKPQNGKKPPKQEEVVVMPDYKKVIHYLDMDQLPEEYFGYFYKKDSYTRSDLSNEIKLYMGLSKVIADNNDKYGDSNKTITIPQKDVIKAMEALFGKEVVYEHQSLTGNSCTNSAFKYDSKKKVYVQKADKCETVRSMSILTELRGEVENDEKIELTVAEAFVDFQLDTDSNKMTYEYYRDSLKNDMISKSNEYSLSTLGNKVNLYRFTFVKENGSFVFDKVERVK